MLNWKKKCNRCGQMFHTGIMPRGVLTVSNFPELELEKAFAFLEDRSEIDLKTCSADAEKKHVKSFYLSWYKRLYMCYAAIPCPRGKDRHSYDENIPLGNKGPMGKNDEKFVNFYFLVFFTIQTLIKLIICAPILTYYNHYFWTPLDYALQYLHIRPTQ